MEATPVPEISAGTEQEYTAGVRVIMLNLPEDEGEGLGFRLTRTLWDPYPWVREIIPGGRAEAVGLKAGDCILQADGKDLLGLPVGQVAGMIRGDGAGCSVTLVVWNCGVDPKDDPELLWSCGGGTRGEKSRRALAGVVRALACCVCASTATNALNCARSHIYCEPCWSRLARCALCREPLPAKNSPYARNLVAEQVFEAIAMEYELKNTKIKRSTESISAQTSPSRSPNLSIESNRRGQYQLSLMNRNKKIVHFNAKFGQTYASDPNIHRSAHNPELSQTTSNPTNSAENSQAGNSGVANKTCGCQNNQHCGENELKVPKINIDNIATDSSEEKSKCGFGTGSDCASSFQSIQHKLVARLRHACSLADLQKATFHCPMSGSLNNLGLETCKHGYHSSLDNLKTQCNTVCGNDSTVFLLPAPPIYVVTCDHKKE